MSISKQSKADLLKEIEELDLWGGDLIYITKYITDMKEMVSTPPEIELVEELEPVQVQEVTELKKQIEELENEAHHYRLLAHERGAC